MKRLKNWLSIFFLASAFSAILFACVNQSEKILGEWKNDSLQKTQLLSERENFDSLFAYAYIQKSTTFSFLQDGTFKKIVSQKVKKIEYIDEDSPILDFSDDETVYTLEGTFRTAKDSVELNVNYAEVEIDGEKIGFSGDELDEQQFLPESRSQSLPYKISERNLELWDFNIQDYLSYDSYN